MKYPICDKYDNLPESPPFYSLDFDDKILRCQKYLFEPNPRQEKLLKKWIKLFDSTYNLTVSYLKNVKRVPSLPKVRSIIKEKLDAKFHNQIAKSQIPYDVLGEAIRDALKSRVSAMALLKSGHTTHFRLRYKKSSSPKKCLSFTEKCFGVAKIIYPRSLNLRIPGLQSTNHSCRVILYRDKWYLSVPQDRIIKSSIDRKKCCGLDPGIRTFLTGYDGQGVFELHNIKVQKKKKQIENIERRDQETRKKSKINKIKRKITQLVDQLHWQSAAWLVKSYDTIYLGNMSTQGIISNKRNLPKTVKREVNFLRPFTFRMRLQTKAEEYGSEIILVDESYTSKTCTVCKTINNSLGSLKTFKCSNCSHVWDRDYNAARNIFLRGLGDGC
jgi:IS605 OrfB family transposase